MIFNHTDTILFVVIMYNEKMKNIYILIVVYSSKIIFLPFICIIYHKNYYITLVMGYIA